MIEEIITILVEFDSSNANGLQYGLDGLWEFALLIPVLCKLFQRHITDNSMSHTTSNEDFHFINLGLKSRRERNLENNEDKELWSSTRTYKVSLPLL